MKILLLNGPNLNLLGKREPEVYGRIGLTEIIDDLTKFAMTLDTEVTAFQSNSEGDLVDAIHHAKDDDIEFILINPGALTHTSVALRDAFLGVDIPFIELHLSNVHAREAFRQVSYLSDVAVGTIAGFGQLSYRLALLAAVDHLKNLK